LSLPLRPFFERIGAFDPELDSGGQFRPRIAVAVPLRMVICVATVLGR
jgi:hypothetical protein